MKLRFTAGALLASLLSLGMIGCSQEDVDKVKASAEDAANGEGAKFCKKTYRKSSEIASSGLSLTAGY